MTRCTGSSVQGDTDSTFGDGVCGLGSTGKQINHLLTEFGVIEGGKTPFAIWVDATDYLEARDRRDCTDS